MYGVVSDRQITTTITLTNRDGQDQATVILNVLKVLDTDNTLTIGAKIKTGSLSAFFNGKIANIEIVQYEPERISSLGLLNTEGRKFDLANLYAPYLDLFSIKKERPFERTIDKVLSILPNNENHASLNSIVYTESQNNPEGIPNFSYSSTFQQDWDVSRVDFGDRYALLGTTSLRPRQQTIRAVWTFLNEKQYRVLWEFLSYVIKTRMRIKYTLPFDVPSKYFNQYGELSSVRDLNSMNVDLDDFSKLYSVSDLQFSYVANSPNFAIVCTLTQEFTSDV